MCTCNLYKDQTRSNDLMTVFIFLILYIVFYLLNSNGGNPYNFYFSLIQVSFCNFLLVEQERVKPHHGVDTFTSF